MTWLNTPTINGENIPVWLAFILALLGIIGCIITAQLVVPNELQSKVFIHWIDKLNLKTGNSITQYSSVDINKNVKLDNLKPKIINNELTPESETGKDQLEILISHDCPTLFTFTFEKNSKEPQAPEKQTKVAQLIAWLDAHPKATLMLEGYSSSKGPGESNLILSFRRSKAVKKFLMEAGISEKQLTTHAFGEEAPLAGEPTTSIKNQRVSMRISGAVECQNHSDNL